MICPNCGSKIEDDKLYCEVCGEEIHFVQDYEPEIEQSITETLSSIEINDLDSGFLDAEEYLEYDDNNPEYSEEYYEDVQDLTDYDSSLDEKIQYADEKGYPIQPEYNDYESDLSYEAISSENEYLSMTILLEVVFVPKNPVLSAQTKAKDYFFF